MALDNIYMNSQDKLTISEAVVGSLKTLIGKGALPNDIYPVFV